MIFKYILPDHHPRLLLFAFLVGVLAGIGAVAFKYLLNLMHNILFSGEHLYLEVVSSRYCFTARIEGRYWAITL